MQWAYPHNSWWFWVIPALAGFLFFAYRRRRQALETLAAKALLPELTQTIHHKAKWAKPALVSAGVVFILIALIGPQWGFHWQEVNRRGIEIIIAVDVSKSMLAEDVKPNRLERAKLAIQDLIPSLGGDRIGLIAFAGTGFLYCPLTVDYGAFLLALEDLSVDTIPRGGTALEQAIREGMRAFKASSSESKAIILISDGETHEGDPLTAAREAAEQGITLFTIGIGTAEGELIPVTDSLGQRSFLKDQEGKTVKSRLDEAVLQQIALATGGSYVKAAPTAFGLERIYRERIKRMEPETFESTMKKQMEHRYQWPLAIAFVLLAIEPLISDRKRVDT